jgi:phytoene dehydrogenase-like protein
MSETPEQTQVIVIGSGIGGLCCAALLARYGFEVVVCESHSIPGGAAHGFERQGFLFDSGPSLYSGMSYRPSTNPLRHVMDAVGAEVDWVTYDTWGCYLPEGDFDTRVGADQFCDVLKQLRGETAVAQWRRLQQRMKPLQNAAIALPPVALRNDWGVALTAGRFALPMLWHLPQMGQLTGAFAPIMDEVITDPFIRNWLDMLCFLLSGLPASGTNAAEMSFMFAEWYRPDVVLDYPVGGSAAMVDALVQSIQGQGGTVLLNAHVEEIWLEDDRARGVRLRNGKVLHARQAVVSAISIWDTLNLLPDSPAANQLRRERQNTPTCDSFMHLHLGIDATGLPADMPCHYITVADWARGVTTPLNLVVASIPSVLDPSLAPPGKHVVHIYTPGNEPYALWDGMDRRSEAYAQLKQERSEVIWRAMERVIPDLRDRCEVTLVGTPLTHEWFLRRHRGSYGPAIAASQGLFPGSQTPVPGLLCCGDSTFPGIGLPAVAASGAIAANTLAPVTKHLEMLEEVGLV